MSKLVQAILREHRKLEQIARSARMSLAKWLRQALDLARRRETLGAGKKLEVIRAAAQYDYPTGDIASMLAGIDTSKQNLPPEAQP